MQITIWGTRGSIASPGKQTFKYGGNTTCITLSPDQSMENALIIDAGTGVRVLGGEIIKISAPVKQNIVFTHTHWDHIQGFPFYMPAFDAKNQIEIYACAKNTGSIKERLLSQMDTKNFPITPDALKARLEFNTFCDAIELNDISIKTMELNHPGSGIGFRFEKDGKSAAFITDHELSEEPYAGYSFKETAGFCEGLDLLIHDAQYLQEEMPAHIGWGHTAVEDAVKLALECEVKDLVLFHHDPNRTDAEIDVIVNKTNSILKSQKVELTVCAAYEGMIIEL